MIDKFHAVVLEQGRTCTHAYLCACMHKRVNEGMYMSVGAWCRAHGVWCMVLVHGAQCMVHGVGAWCMVLVHGAWCMVLVHGAWCWCMVQVKNSSIQGDLATFGSLITSDGWENINRAPLLGFMPSVLVAAAVMITSDLVTRRTWIILVYNNYTSHACSRV
eukprot:365970-Chlamydomonas_euryale.AAC.10